MLCKRLPQATCSSGIDKTALLDGMGGMVAGKDHWIVLIQRKKNLFKRDHNPFK